MCTWDHLNPPRGYTDCQECRGAGLVECERDDGAPYMQVCEPCECRRYDDALERKERRRYDGPDNCKERE